MRPLCPSLALVGASLAAGLGFAMPTRDQTVKSERKVAGFHEIAIHTAFEIDIRHGNRPQVVVEAPKEIQKFISASVRNGRLEVGIPGHHNTNGPLKLHLTTDQLSDIELTGACQLISKETWKANRMRVSLSGASQLRAPLEVASLDLTLTGASQAKLSGKAGIVRLSTTGGSQFSGYKLSTGIAQVDAQGASTVEMDVAKSLAASATGASSIHYRGVKSAKSSVSGAATIARG